MTDTRPNILLIHADQHRFDCLGVNGHPQLQTPNLDSLAAEGMNFTQAYTAIPVCIPARNSLITGSWPSQHLAIANWDTETPRPAVELPTFSAALHDAAYTLGYVGKWHVHPHKTPTDPAYGFHDYVGEAEYTSWRAAQGFSPKPRSNRWIGELDPHVTPEATRAGWGADQTIRLIDCALNENRPFFIRWDLAEPHLPNTLPEPYYSMYPDPAPWPSFPDSLAGKPYIQRQQRRTWKVDDWTWDEWKPIVGRYLGEIALIDAQIGRVLSALGSLAENTLVIYSADHGDMCGAHGMMDKHYVMYDDVVRVPLIARWPGRIMPGTTCDSFVTAGIDLAATFCDAAGVAIPETFQGESLLPLFAGESGRDDIFALYYGNQFGLYSQRMTRDRRWKYIWNATAEDELYDLCADPAELHNLAREAGCADELSRLRHRLVEWMEATGDRLLNIWTRPQLLEGLTE